MKTPSAYVARYPLVNGELQEEIILRDTHWSDKLEKKFDELASARKPTDPMIQGWFSSEEIVFCLATTNQPYKLE